MRDLLIGEIPLVFRPSTYLYATAAFFGAVVYLLLAEWPGHAQTAMVGGTAATLLLRLAGIQWRLALPMYRPRERSLEADESDETRQ